MFFQNGFRKQFYRTGVCNKGNLKKDWGKNILYM